MSKRHLNGLTTFLKRSLQALLIGGCRTIITKLTQVSRGPILFVRYSRTSLTGSAFATPVVIFYGLTSVSHLRISFLRVTEGSNAFAINLLFCFIS